MNHPSKHAAFTLVELAIVLVIIGLIVGGVLVGNDLINAAGTRAAITDIARYNAAANTFRGKYNGLPGDLQVAKAVQFGFNAGPNDASRSDTQGGDGDGRILGCGYYGFPRISCETMLFWVDLSKAGLIPFKTALTSTSAQASTQAQTNAQLGDGILPHLKLRSSALVAVFTYPPGFSLSSGSSLGGSTYFAIGEFYTQGPSDVLMLQPNNPRGLTPLEASNIDEKLDDGIPTTGTVFAIESGTVPTVTSAPTPCTNNTGTNYNTALNTLANVNACAIAIRASF